MVSRSEGRPSSSPRNRKFFARPSPWQRAPNPLRWVVGLASCRALGSGRGLIHKELHFCPKARLLAVPPLRLSPPYVTEGGVEPPNVAVYGVRLRDLHSFVPIRLERYLRVVARGGIEPPSPYCAGTLPLSERAMPVFPSCPPILLICPLMYFGEAGVEPNSLHRKNASGYCRAGHVERTLRLAADPS